ncbi:MAG: arylsulfatase [Pseudomonadota bacterium]
MPRFAAFQFVLLLAGCSSLMIAGLGRAHAQIETVELVEAAEMPALEQRQGPNIVVVLADDAAFTDFGAYGGEIATPTIDGLAARGVQFTNFHASPLCAPSRAMLLTGLDSHEAGLASLTTIIPPEFEGEPGYRGHLEAGVRTVASRLKDIGYQTYAAGKWHLGGEPEHLPPAHGFDRSFVINATGGDHYSERAHVPIDAKTQWIQDGTNVSIPSDFYSSKDLIDRMIEYINEGQTDEHPFFAYIGFLAPHYPLQAPAENIEPYLERYQDGWDRLREERWRRARELGVIPDDAPLANFVPAGRRWVELTPAEQANYAKRMAVYAGMIDSLDEQIGRLVTHLDNKGLLDDTVFIIASDNGPESGDDESNAVFRFWAWSQGYSFDTNRLGRPGTFSTIGPEWASAVASPHSLFKGYTSEGGTRVPLVIAGPGISSGVTSKAFSFITDITPTILDLANAPFDRDALTGRSLSPVLLGVEERIYGDLDPVGLELAGNAALFRGSYKIVRNQPPGSDGEWRLFNIDDDPGETRDLSFAKPMLFQDMLSDYGVYARTMGVRALPEGYDPNQAAVERAIPSILRALWWIPALAVALILACAMAVWWFVLRPFVKNLLSSRAQ